MDNSTNKKSNNGKRGAIFGVLVILILVLVFCICIGGVCFFFTSLISSSDISINENVIENGTGEDKIAVVEIHGMITQAPEADFFTEVQLDMTSKIIDKLDRALNDSNVKAVILDVDTPGGEVYASELIYNKIQEVQDSGKKVVALFRNTAASGGYYISASADHIVASETTITGSIGVRMQSTDLSGLYEKLGIKMIDITNSNGDFKILTNDDIENKESEAYKVLETILDDVYNQFVDVIVDGRGLTRQEVIELADGRVYSGRAASENGLVDSLGYFEDAVAKAEELAGISDAEIIQYSDVDSYWSDLGFKIKSKIETLLSVVPTEAKVETKLLYLLSI